MTRPHDVPSPFWVTGKHPVEELLASRLQSARKVLLSQALPADLRKEIEARAAGCRVPVLTLPKGEWDRRTGEREGGGGVAAEIGSFRYLDLADWIADLPAGEGSLFLLDGITDPHNFGAILRNARAFGIGGVVTPRDRSCPVTGAVFRASAGAAAHVPVIQVTNLARTVEELQEAGFWLYAAEGRGETEVADWKPARRTAIVLGSEEKGVRRLVREKCDGAVRIDMEGIESLNVSVASGILAYALRRALANPRR